MAKIRAELKATAPEVGALGNALTNADQLKLLTVALDRLPRLRRLPGRAVGLGVRREHVRSPEAHPVVRP